MDTVRALLQFSLYIFLCGISTFCYFRFQRFYFHTNIFKPDPQVKSKIIAGSQCILQLFRDQTETIWETLQTLDGRKARSVGSRSERRSAPPPRRVGTARAPTKQQPRPTRMRAPALRRRARLSSRPEVCCFREHVQISFHHDCFEKRRTRHKNATFAKEKMRNHHMSDKTLLLNVWG